LFPFFEKVIKERGLRNVTYIEPFAGGAGAALALLFLEKVDRIVINDLDKAIYSFWISAVFDAEDFVKKIHSTRVTVAEWKRQKAIYRDSRANIFDLGFATFFLNRTNVSGIMNAGPIGGMKQEGKWKIDARFNKNALADKINELSVYKNRITVSDTDGIDLAREYLKQKNVLVYLDPPYYEKAATLYLNHYKNTDHQGLARLLNSHPDAPWLLTYDNKKEIESLYPDRLKISYSLSYNAREVRVGKEILILSDALKP